ncbi:AmmeMemoRadiSam system radical SAM enzyme [Bradyrhizobium pachyrhizi]|uniref:AmmeMemoRadiSam system radical SAM enzyme n=1 Tax=Bradyrhizobium pachyrhizi TaxID=280333 RepID=UPI0018DF108E|nr:AmmeMemoRadiSam system radical SAM enzyme [Bradyrhizobium pachyrhizi]
MTEPERLEGFPGRYWHRLEDGRIQCDICPRYCRLNEGQRGLCFARGRQDDRIVLTTYGRSSGFCVDPIEKKPLNHYLPGTPVLSFGTAGCNLTFKFCQNWDISKGRELDRLQDAASPEDIVEAAIATGSRSIAYTYNDPVILLEYAVDVAKAARRRGIKNVVVTAGYIDAAAREELYGFMDAANVDLKAFTEEFYKRLCTGRLGAVLETLEYLRQRAKVWFEITTLLIPGHNDSSEEVTKLSEWVMTRLGPDVPLHFTAFHPDYKMSDLPRTPAFTLTTARDIARKVGCISSTPGMSMTRAVKARIALAAVSGSSAEIGMTSPAGGSPRMAVAVFAPPQSLSCSRHARAAGGGGASRSGSADGNSLERGSCQR